jgi:hypothetical protein
MQSCTAIRAPCPFFGPERRCTIPEHPPRPEVCRLYPFSFRGGDERCQSFCSHIRVVRALTADAGAFDLYDSSFCPDTDLRPIPDELWPSVLHRFLKADPSAGVITHFVAINHPLLHKTGKRAASPSQVPA